VKGFVIGCHVYLEATRNMHMVLMEAVKDVYR